jgi:hypothetical protein
MIRCVSTQDMVKLARDLAKALGEGNSYREYHFAAALVCCYDESRKIKHFRSLAELQQENEISICLFCASCSCNVLIRQFTAYTIVIKTRDIKY